MFSELVDQIADDSSRADRRASIIAFVNETCREIAKSHDFDADAVEEELYPDADGKIIWKPNAGPLQFRRLEYVEYDCDPRCTPKYVRPNARNCQETRYLYRTRDCFVMIGAITVAKVYYFTLPPYLKYFTENARPAVIQDNIWTDPAQEDLVSNWMLRRHRQVVYDGAMSKLLRLTKDPRQQAFYSAYRGGIKTIISSDGSDELLARQ